MDLPSADLLGLLFKLLPGFLAAAVFHALTPYPKRDILDRVVAALIFTMFAQLAVAVVQTVVLLLGRHVVSLGEWNSTWELAWGAAFGVLLGLFWSYGINKGYTHDWLRKKGVTKRTPLPTQWFSAFSKYERYVILHFVNGRRLMGWPREWPDEPGSGHFLLERPGWVTEDGRKAAMHRIEFLLVSASEVKSVEFLRFADDPVLQQYQDEIRASDEILTQARKERKDDREARAQAVRSAAAGRESSSGQAVQRDVDR